MRKTSKPITPRTGRSNEPSGRQASLQPEHAGKANADPSVLHQGQGPDFQTQDKTFREQNEGVQQLKRDQAHMFSQNSQNVRPVTPAQDTEDGRHQESGKGLAE